MSARRFIRRVAFGAAAFVLLAASGTYLFACTQAASYDASIDKVYPIAPGALAHTTDPKAIARGEHLARTVAGCALATCHGPDLTGGHVTEGGPIGTTVVPNVSVVLPAYTDGEIERLVRHGVKKDGRTVRFMIANTFNWLPDEDVVALLSWIRTVPMTPVARAPMEIRTFGKVMDVLGYIPIDIARRIPHESIPIGPMPEPTAAYGKWLARSCRDCHGEHLSGGPLRGTPPGFPVPLDLTPDATGLGSWSYEDFVAFAESGKRKDGRPVAEFMPTEMLRNMDETEKRALWAYLRSVPAVPFGNH